MTFFNRRILLVLAASALSLGFAGCAADEDHDSGGDSDSDSDTDTDTDTDTDVDTDADSDTDSDSDSDSDSDVDGGGDTVCDEQDFEIEQEPVRLVILQDFSGSMSGTPWSEATTALTNILTLWTGSQIEFGFDYFPIDGDCGVNSTILFDPAPGNESAIASWLTTNSPTGMTPLLCAMENFATYGYTSNFPEGGIDSYLLVVSDGSDTCEPQCGSGGSMSDELSSVTSELLANQIKTFVIGFGYSGTELTAIASAGGMDPPYNVPISASDTATLEAAFNEVAEVVINCIFEVQSPDASADPDNVNFYFDGDVVPMNEGCGGSGVGWQWVDDAHTQVEFCPASCDDIQDGDPPDISAAWGCPTIVE